MLETIAHDDQNILHTTVFQLGQHPKPVLRSLPVAVLTDPQFVSTMRCRLLNEPPEVRIASNVWATRSRSSGCLWERSNSVVGTIAPGS
jgi:hypothetical protein